MEELTKKDILTILGENLTDIRHSGYKTEYSEEEDLDENHQLKIKKRRVKTSHLSNHYGTLNTRVKKRQILKRVRLKKLYQMKANTSDFTTHQNVMQMVRIVKQYQ